MKEIDIYLWIKIKKYLFHRNLWNIPKYIEYNKVIKQIPIILYHKDQPFIIISKSKFNDKFIKIYENIGNFKIISYVYLPKSINEESIYIEKDNSIYLNYEINPK